MKRIAIFIAGGFDDLEPGKYIPALADLFSRLSFEFEVTVFSLTRDPGAPATRNLAGVRVVYQKIRADTHQFVRMARLRKSFLCEHRKRPFDLIHGIWGLPCGTTAVWLSIFRRLPALVSLVGFETAALPNLNYGGMLHQPIRGLLRWTIRHARAVTCLSAFQVCALRKQGLATGHVQVLPYGVDLDLFTAGQRAFEPPFRFLHVANLTEIKDQHTLLDTFRIICAEVPAHLRIVGPDHLQGAVQQRAAALGLSEQVSFTGFVPQNDLPPHFHWAQVLLHTSLHEAQAVVVAEAAASGLLLCGTRVGLMADLEGEASIAVEPGDARGLATSVLDLLKDPARATSLRAAGLVWAQTHDANWTATRFRDLYHELLKR